MNCPKCVGELQQQRFGPDIVVHRCSTCSGLWCKPDMLLQMKREWMSEAVLDSGDPRLGKELDELGDIDCPECGISLDKTYDDEQVHIWFETCSRCGGLFFDAGEFTDLKFNTFLDRIRGIRRGPRPD